MMTALTALAGALPRGMVNPFVFLLAARFLFGAFQSGAFPVWTRAMTDWIPLAERATGQGITWMCSRLGGAVAPRLFLLLLVALGTWTTPLWLIAGVGVVWSVLFWIWFRDQPEQVRSVNQAELRQIKAARPAAATGGVAIPWSTLLTSRNVWALCLMYGFVGFAGNFTTNLLPVYLARERHLSAELVKDLAGLPLAFGIVSCLLGGLISDRVSRRWGNRKWGRRVNGFVGLALAGLFFAVVPWIQSTWWLGFAFSAAFFLNDLNVAPAWAACADVGEECAGTISGAMNMSAQFGGAIGMSLAGYLLERGHAGILFAIFAASYCLAALCWVGVDVTRPLRRA